jgi:RNA polymerase sigma-70 factor (ECF subfamily)
VEDKELINKFLSGDRYAFEQLIKKYQKNIYWHARRMTGEHMDADEITQEVILTIYNKMDTFKFESEFSTWIYRITSNKTLNYLRKEKVRNFLNLDLIQKKDSYDIVKNIEDKEKLENLNTILSNISDKQKEVFILRHFNGLNYKEIAKITGKSIGTLKANYFHAIKKIMEKIKNEKG